MYLIVFAHPDSEKSHNALLLKFVREKLEKNREKYQIIDLYKEKFDPLLSKEEWKGEKNAQIEKYQKMVKEADRLVFIYPVWWYNMPSILKGFFDRVFTNGFAYNFQKESTFIKIGRICFGWALGISLLYPIYRKMMPIKKHLKGKCALIINTFGGFEQGPYLYQNAHENCTDKAVLDFCGIWPIHRVNWYEVRGEANEIPENIQKKIEQKIEKMSC
ncbi:NAD(P)H-dependent oxidoreductase [Candidatus Micrarchaeota archaeon]|nr:NAD(P)H-dependent oxidoreductase [Candidatus Micrarchaeota archaeon]